MDVVDRDVKEVKVKITGCKLIMREMDAVRWQVICGEEIWTPIKEIVFKCVCVCVCVWCVCVCVSGDVVNK